MLIVQYNLNCLLCKALTHTHTYTHTHILTSAHTNFPPYAQKHGCPYTADIERTVPNSSKKHWGHTRLHSYDSTESRFAK